MITTLDCVPCLIRQSIEASGFTSDDYSLREKALREILRKISESDLTVSPPVIARDIHRALRDLCGSTDPYCEVKKKFNSLIMSMADRFRKIITGSDDPLLTAVKLAIAGNVIDSGVKSGLTEQEVIASIESSFSETISGDTDYFISRLSDAKKILYIADNAGEIVFDRLLIELLDPGKVILAVRGFPVINDATVDDAESVGLDRLVSVIQSGSDVPGTLLDDCTEEFSRIFREADLVVAKGQGNYETLCDEERDIFFLLKVKCHVIAAHTGLPAGTHAVILNKHGIKG
ncbi:MAG: DUF89 family protein [Spirochaetes bacterium]|nr:DUF89 family protein [Spirochaetota bacterium]